MKFSAKLPGQHRKDRRTTDEVKKEKGIGHNAGNWVANLWPEGALEPVKKKITEARNYHATVTFPFGVKSEEDEDGGTSVIAGIGILPAAMIKEYGDKMRAFKQELEPLIEAFYQNAQGWVDWAANEHNGTFDPRNYPGCSKDESTGTWVVDAAEFRKVMSKKFGMRSEPLPVPDAEQFTASVSELLGTDADSVNLRVADATVGAQRELMRRLIDPVSHMAHTLAGKACPCSACGGRQSKSGNFKDSLVTNVRDVANLASKLNIAGDPAVDAFAKEMQALATVNVDDLREKGKSAVKAQVAENAQALLAKLSHYKI